MASPSLVNEVVIQRSQSPKVEVVEEKVEEILQVIQEPVNNRHNNNGVNEKSTTPSSINTVVVANNNNNTLNNNNNNNNYNNYNNNQQQHNYDDENEHIEEDDPHAFDDDDEDVEFNHHHLRNEIIEDEDYMDDYDEAPPLPIVGGVRERELLCTILEEDNESTASGASLPRTTNGIHSRSLTSSVIHPKEEALTTTSTASIDDSNVKSENEPTAESLNVIPQKDGHYFIKLIENEVFKFEEQICDFEEDLCNNDSILSEEIREMILAAIGKAKLLMSQKLMQFRGLCDKNITLKYEEDPFVPTSDDLAGFWDMVYIQVEHIHSLFAELILIRNNNWVKPEVKKPAQNGTKKVIKKKVTNNNNSSSKSSNNSSTLKNGGSTTKPGKSEAAKARDEARKKMMEERKKMMKQKKMQQNGGGDADVELFVPL